MITRSSTLKGAIVIGLIAAILPAFFTTTITAAPTAGTCRTRVVRELTAIHDEYRAHVFGTRVDRDGKNSVLTGGFSDQPQVGILETQQRMTSELVGPLVDSYRVLRCRSLTICEIMTRSINAKDTDTTVRPLGCVEVTRPLYGECYLSGTPAPDEPGTAGSLGDSFQLEAFCKQVVSDTLTYEQSALGLAVGYDTGYRSTLQIAGMMDWMQEDLVTSSLEPIRNMVNLLGKLYQIPCFIGQCDYAKHNPL